MFVAQRPRSATSVVFNQRIMIVVIQARFQPARVAWLHGKTFSMHSLTTFIDTVVPAELLFYSQVRPLNY